MGEGLMNLDSLITIKELTRIKLEPGELLVVHLSRCSGEMIKNITRTFDQLGIGNVLIDEIGVSFSAIKDDRDK